MDLPLTSDMDWKVQRYITLLAMWHPDEPQIWCRKTAEIMIQKESGPEVTMPKELAKALIDKSATPKPKNLYAGMVVGALLMYMHTMAEPSLNKAIFLLEQDFANQEEKSLQIAKKRTIINYWKSHKTIAPLWFAYIETRPNDDDQEKFREFLGLADSIQEWATTTFAHGQTTPILSRDELLSVPATIPRKTTSANPDPKVRSALTNRLKHYKATIK